MFQTRHAYNLAVRVLGSKLRAGRKPLEGQIVIDTNGGTLTFKVRASVPIRPFPKGKYANDSLAGAKSPHELAVKAKAHPQEAAALFEQGAVSAWYASNGWTYPVQDTKGTGKGAVQQFFEALGLTKPPQLEISGGRIVCKARAGQRLVKHVTLSTKESRYVYAQAWSNQEWVKAGTTKAQGNTAVVPLHIDVPARPGETLHANVTVQGNGQQRFVVPVTLAVAAGESAAEPEAEPEEKKARFPLGLLIGGLCLVLVVAASAIGLVLNHRADEAATGALVQPAVAPNDANVPPPLPVAAGGAWWDSIPDSNLAASAAAVKAAAPAERALFDALAARADVERNPAYERLAVKLPELLRNAPAREPLARFVTGCCVFEPSDLNLSPLRAALKSQVPREKTAFRPEDKGEELERARWTLQTVCDALTHRAIRPERAQGLTGDLGTAFGFALDTRAAPEQLRVQAEQLLAERLYRNTLPTAGTSLDHALAMRAALLDKLPQLLPPAVREPIDVELAAGALSKGNEAWPKVEPVVKACLQSKERDVGMKLADLYEKANPALATNLQGLMADRWPAVANPKLTQAARAAAIRRSVLNQPDPALLAQAAREDRLQKLTSKTLSAVKAAEKKDVAVLRDTVRLAHASTMACALFHKDTGAERFDELVAKVPDLDDPEAAKTEEKKPADQKATEQAAKGVIVVGLQPTMLQGVLTPASDRDPGRGGTFCKVYTVALKAGQVYTIDMMSGALDSYLRLEAPNGVRLAEDDDSGGGRNARIVYPAPADGAYRVIATTCFGGAIGPYVLRIQLGAPFGAPRFFPGRRLPFRPPVPIGPGGPFMPVPPPGGIVVQEAPKVEEKKEPDFKVSDLKDLVSKQSQVRVAALNKVAAAIPKDLAPRHALKIARYLLVTIQQKSELDEVAPKLESLGKCRHLLLALADEAADESATQQTTEAVVGGVLGQPLRFARDEDWRTACRKLLLQRVLELTTSTTGPAAQAADMLRDLYKEQGVAFGLEDPKFLALTRPTRVLEALTRHVAGKIAPEALPAPDREYLAQLDRHLQAARVVAETDLEHMVLLQRVWLRVLALSLRGQVPAQAEAMRQLEQDLTAQDRQARTVLEQLRAGEEKVLRVWALVSQRKSS
jgi:hypothetical protein